MGAFVHDYETLSNCFIGIFESYTDPTDTRIFVIHSLRNDFVALVDFLENCVDNGDWLIGFNSIGFDSQLSEFLLRTRDKLSLLSAEETARAIYEKAQKIIDNQDKSFGFRQDYPEWKLSTKNIDLFKLNHWDNPARRSSLKWIQFTLDWPCVAEMPIHHSTIITTQEEIDSIIEYCINDVKSTKEIYNRSKGLLEVRKKVKDKYKLKCYSWSNTKMGSELLLKMYCEKIGKKKFDIKQTGTKRGEIILKDILFPYIEFKTIEFTELLVKFKSTVIKNTKGEFKYSINFRGSRFDYGTGGMHQCIIPGAYQTDDQYDIWDIDVTGLYPNIACVNQMYPAHLGPEFYEVYKQEIVDVRTAEKQKGKLGDKAIIDGFKEASNASFGNSNNEHSWLSDPQYLLQTTVNGQLMITMLVESISLGLTDVQILQTNTDGVTIRCLKSQLNEFRSICTEWEKITRLTLEYAQYKSIFVRDVNNYLGVYTDPAKGYKAKGIFEYENMPLHKNKSFLVVPKAIYEFFVNGIAPEQYLQSNRNIYDYCGGARVTSDWKFFGTCVVDGLIQQTQLQKVIRYYISNKGCKIVKINQSDNRKINVVAGIWLQTELNTVDLTTPWDQWDINESFYLDQIYKEIGALSKPKQTQLTLW